MLYNIKEIFSFPCLGRGGKEGAVGKCKSCKGTGMQIRIHQIGPGMVQQIQSVCHECRGEGESIDPKHMCKNCNGKKVIRERKILEVHIDKGIVASHLSQMNAKVLVVLVNCNWLYTA